ncbi:MAG TPA: cytochrome c oxidase subunit II [Gemmatimonadales bacterium]
MTVALFAACGGPFPQSTLIPKGDFAQMVDEVFSATVRWATLVFVLVEGVLIVAILKFRQRPGDAEPTQTHGNTVVEMVWTIIPAAILTFIAVPTVRTIFRTAELPEGGLEVEVIGHQWWWEFRYPAQQIVTANEMHVPAGRPVIMKIRTADVLHSFWVPQLSAKRDAFPNKYTTLFFTTDSLGEFTGQCAEFCGLQHGRMGSLVVVQTPDEFAQWVERNQVGSPLINRGVVAADSAAADTARGAGRAAQDSIEAKGRETFLAAGCIGCHAMVGTPTAGVLTLQGPNLSHFGSRRRLAAGMLPNTPENLAAWLRDPQAVKEGSLMKLPRPLTEAEISTLVAYLRAHQ